jgi:hypothetical protein
MKFTQTTAQKFDPIDFLGIRGLGEREQEDLRKKLEVNIAEYILICLLDELPDTVDEKLKEDKVRNIDELEKLLSSNIPDFDRKVGKYLQEFKKQYNKENE